MRALVIALALVTCAASPVQAQESELPLSPPYASLVREHYYAQLAKSPWRALGWELVTPGAGSAYTGLYVQAAATLGVSLAGAGLWIAGAVRSRPALAWAGMGVFAAGRTYGIVSAPVSAALLNAVFRRQLGITAQL